MPKFPADVPKAKAIKIFEQLGFRTVREGNHIAMERDNEDGTKTPLTMPNHRALKGPTLRAILTQTGFYATNFSPHTTKLNEVKIQLSR